MNSGASRLIVPSLVALSVLISAASAWAHVEPLGCAGDFVTMGIRIFRADHITQIAGGETVSPCETIEYEVTVAAPGGNTCAFQGGQVFVTTPDGVLNDVTPAGGVPCLGGD